MSETQTEDRLFSAPNLNQALASAASQLNVDPRCLEVEYADEEPSDDMTTIAVRRVLQQDELKQAYADERGALDTFIRGMLEALDLDCQLEIQFRDWAMDVDLTGDDAPLLTRNKGKILNEIQFLANCYFKSVFPKTVLELKCDADDYRKNREKSIQELTRKSCETLVEPGDSVVLDPMNAYERRTVHLALKDKTQYKTVSLGDGYFKRVKIILQNAESVQEPSSTRDEDAED